MLHAYICLITRIFYVWFDAYLHFVLYVSMYIRMLVLVFYHFKKDSLVYEI